MSVAYCKDCLKRIVICDCGNPSGEEVYGETRRAILKVLYELLDEKGDLRNKVYDIIENI